MSLAGRTASTLAVREPRSAALRRLRTINRVTTTQPIDTTIRRTHATVRTGSVRNSDRERSAATGNDPSMASHNYHSPSRGKRARCIS